MDRSCARLTDTGRPPLTPAELAGAIDMVVRGVLSHVMQPSGTPAGTAASLGFIARRVLSR